MRAFTLSALVLALLAACCSPALAWSEGRATFYGNEPWYSTRCPDMFFVCARGAPPSIVPLQPSRPP
jgi:hypothetical protein